MGGQIPLGTRLAPSSSVRYSSTRCAIPMNSSRNLGRAELRNILRKPQAIEEGWSSPCPKVLTFTHWTARPFALAIWISRTQSGQGEV
jgi:hypothetical protein